MCNSNTIKPKGNTIGLILFIKLQEKNKNTLTSHSFTIISYGFTTFPT